MKIEVCLDQPEPLPAAELVLVVDRNLVTGSKELEEQLGTLTSLEKDLLVVAASVFAADLAVARGEREAVTRNLELNIPVVNYHAFTRLVDEFEYILYLLSNDNWSLTFVAAQGQAEIPCEWPRSEGHTLLFSGGLDSLAAAVEQLDSGANLQLASHYTRNIVTKKSQEDLFEYLQVRYGDRVTRFAARITGQRSGDLHFPTDDEREASQRTRSFVFLTIAAIVARRRGFRDLLLIAENGQLAIHLPLTAARIGSFSTHTAHPEFVHEMESLLADLFSFPFSIKNPFLYKTKAECIHELSVSHPDAIGMSVSCWKGSRQRMRHCGECVPCMVRRIALEYHGIHQSEYERDIFIENISELPPDDNGKRNLIDLAEFVVVWSKSFSGSELELRYPELFNLQIDRDSAISMYRRFAHEAMTVFTGYPSLTSVLQ